MVSKKADKKGKVRVGKLSVKKETVKDLESEEMQKVKGGFLVEQYTTNCANSIACASNAVCKTDICASDMTCGGKTCGKKCNP
jgi:hypothetical protein